MLFWISALLGAFLSLGGSGINVTPDAVVGTARIAGPVYLNGNHVSQSVLVTDGDRLDTGPGGVVALNVSATDRLILGERSSIRLHSSSQGVSAEVTSGRMQVNTSQQRLKEVRLTDEGISINAAPGIPHDYLVTRLANASYVMARHGGLTIVDEGYGGTTNVPEGMVGTVRTTTAHADPPAPQAQARPVSTGASGTRAGSITALMPEDFINRGGTESAAQKGSILNLNDRVISKERGRVRMVLDDGSILNLGSSSEMKVTIHDAKSQATQVDLAYGRIRAQVRKVTNPNSPWEIRTSTAICGVLGTEFFVEADNTKTRLIVYQGRVSFTPIRAGVVVANAAISVVAGQTSTAVGGAVASPVASGASSTAAAASTTITSQGASAAGTAAVAASRVGVVTAAAAPTAAGAAIIGSTVANSNSGNNSNSMVTVTSGTVSGAKP